MTKRVEVDRSKDKKKEYLYSEMFLSLQGEATFAGSPSVWLRYFGCSLQCNGFGQTDPTDPSTYKLPYKDLNVDNYLHMEDLPVFDYGCDSSYSWSANFKKLQRSGTPEQIAQRLLMLLPGNKFVHANEQTGRWWDYHLCITGGEPFMPKNQVCTNEMMKYFHEIGNKPRHITFETNGTQPLSEDLVLTLKNKGVVTAEVFMSVSPKLFTTSGEKPEKAIKPDVIHEYYDLFPVGHLKFVISGTDQSWEELERTVDLLYSTGVYYPVWVMKAGSTLEGQKGIIPGHLTEEAVASAAVARGFKYATRQHINIFGNKIGT